MRRPTRTRPASALVALAALGLLAPLSGCGEKEEPATTGPVVAQSTSPVDGSTTTSTPARSDAELVTAAARSFLTSTDAARVCDEVITPALLEQAYGGRAGCLAARNPQTLARSVAFPAVRVQGERATLTARAKGGMFGNGQTLKLTAVGDAAGTWRVATVSGAALK